jgi:uncharacterized repeat protein (TIGR01451 family)
MSNCIVNFYRTSHSSLRRSLRNIFLSSLPLIGLAFALPVYAQINLGEVIDPHLCAGDFNANLSCVSNDIQINDVSQLGDAVQSCTQGDTVVLDIQLTTLLNATGRYDAVVWFGKNGNNPRAVGGGQCFASSLPDDPPSAFILDLEGGGDSCLDVNSSTDPVIQYFYDIEVDCLDNFSPDPNGSDPYDVIGTPDGELDLFAVVTWGQASGTLQCGDGTVGGESLEAGGNPKCDASILLGIDVEVIQNPGLQLTKTGTLDDTVVPPSGVANPGDIINYAFLVENTGDTTVGDITLADTVGGVSVSGGPIVSLAAGATDSTTFTASYAITQADIDAGLKNNTATVTGDSPTGTDDVTAQDIEQVNITQNSSITLTKGSSPSTYDTVGDVISYTYDVLNSGNTTLAGPATAVDDKATVTCPALTTIGNLDGNLDPGETVQCTASYNIVQADIDSGSVTNTATATVDLIDSNQDMETVNAVQADGITLTKGSSPSTYDTVGDVISYTYDILNSGNTSLAGPATVADDKTTVICPALTTIGDGDSDLDPQESVQCSATYIITQGDIDGGSVMNTATATVESVNSNPDSETVNAIQTGSLSVVKTGSFADDGNNDGFADAGETLNFTFAVTNTGNVTATNVTITDNVAGVVVSGGPLASLAPGATDTTTFTAAYVLTEQDITNGFFSNLASATGASAAGALLATDTELVVLLRRPPPPPEAVTVPVMSQWAMALMAMLLLFVGWAFKPARVFRK